MTLNHCSNVNVSSRRHYLNLK